MKGNVKTESNNINGETRWGGYIAAIGLGGSLKAGCARLCKRLKADSPGDARRKVEDMLVQGKIDSTEYQTYMEAIDTVAEMYEKGEQTHVVTTNPGDWDYLPSGGHRRKYHIGSHG